MNRKFLFIGLFILSILSSLSYGLTLSHRPKSGEIQAQGTSSKKSHQTLEHQKKRGGRKPAAPKAKGAKPKPKPAAKKPAAKKPGKSKSKDNQGNFLGDLAKNAGSQLIEAGVNAGVEAITGQKNQHKQLSDTSLEQQIQKLFQTDQNVKTQYESDQGLQQGSASWNKVRDIYLNNAEFVKQVSDWYTSNYQCLKSLTSDQLTKIAKYDLTQRDMNQMLQGQPYQGADWEWDNLLANVYNDDSFSYDDYCCLGADDCNDEDNGSK